MPQRSSPESLFWYYYITRVCVCVCVCVCVLLRTWKGLALLILTNEGRFGGFTPAQWDMWGQQVDGDSDTVAKGQGVLFQILSVTRKLSASENRTEKKVWGEATFKVKSTQIHRGKEKSAGGSHQDTMQKLDLWSPEWGPVVPGLGPRSTRTYFS